MHPEAAAAVAAAAVYPTQKVGRERVCCILLHDCAAVEVSAPRVVAAA